MSEAMFPTVARFTDRRVTRTIPFGNGHINDTYMVTLEDGHQLVLQRLNTYVFRDPDSLMTNMQRVTDHLRDKLIESGGDPKRGTLTLVPTANGAAYVHDHDVFWRCFDYVTDTHSVEQVESREQAYKAAAAFGRFQHLLADLKDPLSETIPFFHHTPKRVEACRQALVEDHAGRSKGCPDELEFFNSREPLAASFTNLLDSGDLPLRVIHNDTKINNVLFDNESGEPVCVVDLDTVMPGTILFDFGDLVRTAGGSFEEDSASDKVGVCLDRFEALVEGYLDEAHGFLNDCELRNLALSPRLMAYECGTRFLTDYLNGDTYFKIHYPDQNLQRARTQYRLVQSCEDQAEAMEAIVQKHRQRLGI